MTNACLNHFAVHSIKRVKKDVNRIDLMKPFNSVCCYFKNSFIARAAKFLSASSPSPLLPLCRVADSEGPLVYVSLNQK